MNRQEEARGMEDCYESLSNRQVIAQPTPLTDPRHLTMGKLPDPLNPSSSGFGGLEVACWPLEPKVEGSNPVGL
jgi:hypothetical protein